MGVMVINVALFPPLTYFWTWGGMYLWNWCMGRDVEHGPDLAPRTDLACRAGSRLVFLAAATQFLYKDFFFLNVFQKQGS